MKRHRILVVDDDPSIRRLLTALLRRHGYETLAAANGLEALAQMRGGRPDLVIMDLGMPVMSGWDVLRERANDQSLQRIPILVVTASNIHNAPADTLPQHVCGVMAKPFDLDAILARVTGCLEHSVVVSPRRDVVRFRSPALKAPVALRRN
jgi:twitching motility two-component system response regulator PilH